MVFLATPHKGANSAKLLNTLLSTYPLSSSKIYISELEKNSGLLQDINDQFRTVCEGLKLVSFYETRKTHMKVGGNRIVSFYLFIYRRVGLMPGSSLRSNLLSLDTPRRKHPNLMRTIMGCASLRISMIQSMSSSETCLSGLQRVLYLSVSCGVLLLEPKMTVYRGLPSASASQHPGHGRTPRRSSWYSGRPRGGPSFH